jgi:hypothetical protein
MIYGEAKIVDGKLVVENTKEIDQSTLTSECWLIQFNGLDACKTCECLGKKDCGGKNIRKRLLKKV